MEKQKRIRLGIIFCIIIFFGLISLSLCIAAEFKKSKIKDLRIDGNLCSLPGSRAFELGTTALITLFIAQIIANILVCKEFYSRKYDDDEQEQETFNSKTQRPVFPIVLQIISWLSFGITAILIGTSSSMNKSQAFGKGWLDGQCYLVKNGVYFGSAFLIVVTLSSILTSAILLTRITLSLSQQQSIKSPSPSRSQS